MKKFLHRALVLAAVFATALPLLAAPKTEKELLTLLNSQRENFVVDALQTFEKRFPDSVEGMAKCKELLTDSRPPVRRKAARVLGALHAPVSEADLKNICGLLESKDDGDITAGLKALRGLKAQSVALKMLPLLQHANDNVKRDTCRTLAVIGDKSMVKDIEPLLKSKEPAVVEDAQKAINALK